MTIEQRKEVVTDLFSKAIAVIEDKGKAYSGDADTLSNFKRIADYSGMTKYEVWYVYFMKHMLAISNSIKDNPEFPVEKTESMHGRIMDAINYLTILQCMLEEDVLSIGEEKNEL